MAGKLFKESLAKVNQEWLGYILVAVLCVVARSYLISDIGLVDYDSVRNWEILQELGRGKFTNLFHHASPGFFLLFAPFTYLFSNPVDFIYLNVLFGVGSVLLLIRFFRQQVDLPEPEVFLTGLTFGLSVFAVHHSRDLSIESLSLFLFMLLLDRYYQRIATSNKKALLQAVMVLAVGLTVNYKIILVLPVAMVIEVFQRDGVLTKTLLFKAGLILVVPFVLFGSVALALGQPFYRFPAAIISINNLTRPNPALRTGRFNTDFFYYLRYLMQYEWPLLVPALVLFPFLFRQQLLQKIYRQLNIIQFLFLIIFLYLAGMQLLVKAPRGLAVIYGPIYFIFYLVLRRLVSNRLVVIFILGLAIGFQVWKLQKKVYRYSYSSYPAVVDFLVSNNIKKIASTVGKGIGPLATKNGIEVKVVFSEAELPALKSAGFDYVLQDAYYKPANIQQFKQLEKYSEVKTWPNPALADPLVYLNHSEFTGLSYVQTLALHQKSTRDSVQLRLLRIP